MNRFGRQFLVLSLLSLAACSERSLKPAESSSAYFTDARQCRNETQETVKIKINPVGALGTRYGNAHIGGGVADIPIQLGFDPGGYRVCMENRGWKTDPAKDPYIAAIATCRKSAEIPATATRSDETDSLQINGSFDKEAYEACLRGQGLEERVIVHPIRPVPPP